MRSAAISRCGYTQSLDGFSHTSANPCAPHVHIGGCATSHSGKRSRNSGGVIGFTTSWSKCILRKRKSRNIGPSNHQWPKSSASYGLTTSGGCDMPAAACWTCIWRLKRKFAAWLVVLSLAQAGSDRYSGVVGWRGDDAGGG